MALLLRSQPQRESDFFVGALVGNLHDIFGLANNGVNSNLAASTTAAHYYYRLTPFPEQFLTSNLQRFEWKDIHIPHWPSLAAYNLERDHLLHSSLPRTAHGDRFQLSVSKWSHHVLKLKGYSIAENCTSGPDVCTVDISGAPESFGIIRIDVRRCECTFGAKEGFLSANVVLDSPGRTTTRSPRERHEMDHFTHIQSWTIRNGTASKEFPLDGRHWHVTVRLTFRRRTGGSGTYILGVEIWHGSTESGDRGRSSDDTRARSPGRARDISKTKHDEPLRSDFLSIPFLGAQRPSTSRARTAGLDSGQYLAQAERPELGSRSSTGSMTSLVGFNLSTMADAISSAVERAVHTGLFRGGVGPNPAPSGTHDATPPQTLRLETQPELKYPIAPPISNAMPTISIAAHADTPVNYGCNSPVVHTEHPPLTGDTDDLAEMPMLLARFPSASSEQHPPPNAWPAEAPTAHPTPAVPPLQLPVKDLHHHDNPGRVPSEHPNSLWCYEPELRVNVGRAKK
ncbi:uncharacterized protein TRAVEDRAFT_17678 [Trametes versicolor FP-101664 SS1]|uniref:uncharacterized protein n=1 Tax=Trametes versicolor (strain FP-101664) TaxID=717944 RepID=UPI00046245A5|nr:uncharacterized protein TRAVEDRAFT_17678 [Trametes versicolor FP-101664 SS1]EIW63266.1 hypothetical protein TRAVEDRAFT_17678 [Trametes versicolor FP-101664 SS1]